MGGRPATLRKPCEQCGRKYRAHFGERYCTAECGLDAAVQRARIASGRIWLSGGVKGRAGPGSLRTAGGC